MQKFIRNCFFSLLLISPLIVQAAQFNPGQMAEGAPPELMHWGQLVGQWRTTEETLKQDGSGWVSLGTADWDMFWGFDGWGIQDNYTSPSVDIELEDESQRMHGTNLRIYNSAEENWVVTWLTNKSSKPMSLTATSTREEIVMLSDEVGANGNWSRITFFDMAEDTFEWKLEWSKDKETWREVYRIHGRKRVDVDTEN